MAATEGDEVGMVQAGGHIVRNRRLHFNRRHAVGSIEVASLTWYRLAVMLRRVGDLILTDGKL